MSKEWLEEAEIMLENITFYEKLRKEDVEVLGWLIKQAEKADRPQNNLIEEMEKVDFLHEKLIETKKQNKRYREVIDSMRLHAHYPELIKQIYEALEESE